ncbi:PREDICTED: DNA helicase B [Gekko japonicus]|uniref:DNA helicase B n=1 Tax=Gekko japonicus TaxID=146911 RepID=A0ABM1JX23_GEKJA|nr:PREDICTED: DNA helicase B [Gekko japonicus]
MTPPSGQGGKGISFELRGLLLPDKTARGKEEEEDEEEEDGDDPEPLVELPEHSSQLSFSQPSRRTVVIKDEKSQKEYPVVGRFPFKDPWWEVNVKVKQAGSKFYAQGYPSYFLSTHPGENWQAVISLFLKACKVPEEFTTAFFEWLPQKSSLNFEHLEKKLNQFMVSKCQERKDSGNTKDFNIFHYIKNSPAGKAMLVALDFPALVEFLPTLLPYSISSCIGWLDWSEISGSECSKLAKLNMILTEEPWKLGFSTIVYRDLHTYIGEAPWKAFCEFTQLLEKIPDLQKNALMIYAKLQKRCREMGHTYEELDELMRMVPEMSTEHVWQSLQFMKDEKIVVIERKLVFLHKLYKAEKDIALVISELIKKTPWQFHVDVRKVLNSGAHMNDSKGPVVENKLNDEEEPNSDSDVQENMEETPRKETCEAEVDPDQENAVELICSNPVTVMSGKGGCGKTTVVSYLFSYLKRMEFEEVRRACKDFEADQDTSEEWNTYRPFSDLNIHSDKSGSLEVLFTAPTGRAAGLLSKKTDLPAYTLHQVVYSYYSGAKPWKFSKVKVLVVDEGSLVSVTVLSRVLNLLFHSAQLAKLVILGDIRQLPSIEPGNMLCNVFESLKSRGWSVELRTNHRAESQLIVDNSTRISQRIYPEFDAVLRRSDQNKAWPMPSPEKKFICVVLSSEDDLQSAIKALLKGGPGLEDAEQSQFISFRRKDCDIINELCCQHYSQHPMRNHKNQLQFQCGDKICSTRNAYRRDLLPNDKTCTKNNKDSDPCGCDTCFTREDCLSGRNPPSHENDDTRLCNGDIFFIEEDREVDKRRLLTIRSTDGFTDTLLYRGLRRVCKIQHAWARTIHTFQGSEEKTVVYVVGNAGRQNWQHVYTAVTRGCSRVYIVAEEAKLQKAIANKEFPRKTHLRKHLQDAFMGKIDSSEEMFSSQRNVQSKEDRIYDFAPHAGNNCINLEEAAVSDEMKNDNRQRTVELMEMSRRPGGLKRQSNLPEDSSSPSKVMLIKEDNSPLGIKRLQNMTLEGPVPKKLFPL